MNIFRRDGDFDFFSELGFCFTERVRGFTMKELIDEDTKSPYVCFLAIGVINEGFRGHIEG